MGVDGAEKQTKPKLRETENRLVVVRGVGEGGEKIGKLFYF